MNGECNSFSVIVQQKFIGEHKLSLCKTNEEVQSDNSPNIFDCPPYSSETQRLLSFSLTEDVAKMMSLRN